MTASSPLPNPILLGIVGGAHGIRGEVRIKSYTDDPTDIGAYGPLTDAKGNRFTIVSARFQKTVVIARFKEVADRDHAERLNGTELFVDRSALPEEEEDGFYQSDMVGLSVVTLDGETVGTVLAFHDFGAGDIVEIAPPRGPSLMIPFSQAAAPEIDLEARRMVVDPLAAGLVDGGERPEDEGHADAGETRDGGD